MSFFTSSAWKQENRSVAAPGIEHDDVAFSREYDQPSTILRLDAVNDVALRGVDVFLKDSVFMHPPHARGRWPFGRRRASSSWLTCSGVLKTLLQSLICVFRCLDFRSVVKRTATATRRKQRAFVRITMAWANADDATLAPMRLPAARVTCALALQCLKHPATARDGCRTYNLELLFSPCCGPPRKNRGETRATSAWL